MIRERVLDLIHDPSYKPLKKDEPFKYNQVNGLAKFYNEQTGKLEYETVYVDNMREGLSKKYYPNGKLLSEVIFKKDKEEGILKAYYESGKPQGEIPYKNGLIHGTVKRYDENGKVIEQVTYKDGKEVK